MDDARREDRSQHQPDVPGAGRLYPVEPWAVRETAFDPAASRRSESAFALGNGYLGLRGTFEEGLGPAAAHSTRGTYLNGFHETGSIHYPENAYGLARTSQTLVNVMDPQRIELFVDGECFAMGATRVEGFERVLDMRAGVLTRELSWEAGSGARLRLKIERLVSLRRRETAAFRYSVTVEGSSVNITWRSYLDGRVANAADADDPRAGGSVGGRVLETVAYEAQGGSVALSQRTRASGLTVACAARHRVQGGAGATLAALSDPEAPGVAASVRLRPGESALLEKTVAFADDRASEAGGLRPEVRAAAAAEAASEAGFDTLAREQREALDAFWERADIRVDGDAAVQQALRFGLLQLFQGVGRDGTCSIAAKGLSGPGYEGHLFWDAELYVLPALLASHPELARSMLLHRVRALGAARERAAELEHAGALYPWRTITGQEASAYFPAGTAQIHINADIAYALERYLEATGDESLLWQGGAAMLFETARFWLSRGSFVPRRGGAFCLHTVTGPDEYTALVDNNLYTNVMARAHLRFAARTYRAMQAADAARFIELAAELGLEEDEPGAWREAAERMLLPFDAELGIHPQDDGFLDKEPWDPSGIPTARRPLLLHYHPLDIYRRQVLKQADVVLALYLQEQHFSRAEARRDYAYYERLTTHDSSLSPCVHGIVAARLGRAEEAAAYLRRTARMDLEDVNRNVKDGLHTAAMGGAVLGVLHGLAGMRVAARREPEPAAEPEPTFVPRVPPGWRGYAFRVAFRGRVLEVDVGREETCYRLVEGDALRLQHRLEPVTVHSGEVVARSNRPRLRAVLFDLDGVLTDTAEYHYRAWQALADRLGIPFDRAANEGLRGVGRMESLERILARGDVRLAAEEKAALADEKNRHYQRLIEGITPGDLLPGIAELLTALRTAGIRVAVASASRNAPMVVTRLGIEDAVDVVVDARAVVKGKPDPEVFLRAAEALGVLEDDCLGVEDAEAGVAAVLAADMAAVGVGGERVAAAHLAVEDTRELDLALLRRAFARAETAREGGGPATGPASVDGG